jgi:hypothetical protein
LFTAPVTSTNISGSEIVIGMISGAALIWVFPRRTINKETIKTIAAIIPSAIFC